MKRKNYSKESKSKVALAAIKGNQTVNEIVSEFGIHTSLVNVSGVLTTPFLRLAVNSGGHLEFNQVRCLNA